MTSDDWWIAGITFAASLGLTLLFGWIQRRMMR